MHTIGFPGRLVARAGCLLAAVSLLLAIAPVGTRAANLRITDAHAVNSVYDHAWLNGQVAHTRYQVVLSIPGPGVIYTSKPSPLVSSNVSVGANEVYTATTSDTLTIHPPFLPAPLGSICSS